MCGVQLVHQWLRWRAETEKVEMNECSTYEFGVVERLLEGHDKGTENLKDLFRLGLQELGCPSISIGQLVQPDRNSRRVVSGFDGPVVRRAGKGVAGQYWGCVCQSWEMLDLAVHEGWTGGCGHLMKFRRLDSG